MPRYDKPEYEGDSRPDTQKHIDKEAVASSHPLGCG